MGLRLIVGIRSIGVVGFYSLIGFWWSKTINTYQPGYQSLAYYLKPFPGGRRSWQWLLLCPLLFVPLEATAGLFEEGQAAMVSGDYEKATSLFLSAANQGSLQAQLALGSLYQKGQGVPQSSKNSIKWYQKAAERGHVFAQHHLGTYYLKEQEGGGNKKLALAWLLTAAENGYGYSKRLLNQIRDDLPVGYLENE